MEILVADDDDVIRTLMRTVLTQWNYKVYEASNGVEAMKTLDANPGIQLVILDWVMPVMDGLHVCRRMQCRSKVPYVLVFTGNGSEETVRQEILDAGSNDFLAKPFVPEMLWWKLLAAAKFLKDEAYSREIEHLRILLVDDDLLYRSVLKAALLNWKHEVMEACDGIRAMEILESDNRIQVVVLDWDMPGMNGLEVCQSLRKKEKVPYILMATGRKMEIDVRTGWEAGVNDYLCKPFNMEMLQSRLVAAARFMGKTIRKAPSPGTSLEPA